ncbi:hypothetical protein LBMAG53_11790 [Planctomycetota bacterium]|nr:hypothetical protein LBMAG53_11790 [Planctomycetota bacterium]
MKRLPIVLGVLAAATLLPAWLPPATSSASDADSVVIGKQVAPEQIGSLLVASWDKDTASNKIFQVKREAGAWVIPSHHNYPADGNTRTSRVAGSLLGLKRGMPVPIGNDHDKALAELELLDPLAKDVVAKDGFGKVVKLADLSGAEVLNLIIGKAASTGDGHRYVREQGSNKVYTAKISDFEITTKFTDFVEPNPLKLDKADVRALTVADYTVDEASGQVIERSETHFSRPTGDGAWATPKAPTGKQPSKTTVDAILSQVTGLQLVSVRPFEPGWLKDRGFFLSNDPKVLAWSKSLKVELAKKQLAIFANEGRLDVTTKDGLRYSLLFGEIAPDDAADTAAEKAKKDPAKAEDPSKITANRYLAVFVTYDPALDEDAKKDESKDKKDEAKPEDKKKKSGKERAAKAQARYQQFFYVINDASFKSLRPELAKLFEDLPPEPMAGATGKTNVQWLADHAKEPGVTTTASGLQYQILSKGAPGGKRPTATSKVKVNYKGTKVDGTVFDESAKHGGPAEFQLGQVVQGWNEGIPLMQVGDKYTFWIPPAIGYGGKDKNPPTTIGPDQILIFEVELLEVLSNPASEPAAPAPAAPAPAPTPAAAAPAPAPPATAAPAPAPAPPAAAPAP